MRLFTNLRVRQTIAASIALFALLVVLDELDTAERDKVIAPSLSTQPSLRIASVVTMRPVSAPPNFLRLGYVEPLKLTEIMSDVSGRIVSITDAFRKGQLLEQHSALIQLDPLPYKVSLANAQAQLLEAKTALKNAQTQYESQSLIVGSAKSQLQLAQLRVEQAQADLNRTVITLPFDGELVQIKANLGEYVSSGSSIASALPKETREIRVPINIEEFAELDLPLQSRPVHVLSLNKQVRWQGTISGVSHFSENQQRTLYITIDSDTSSVPMFGENVYVQLPHKTWTHTYSVPESALTEKYEIWLVDEHNSINRHKLNEFTIHDGLVYFPMPTPQTERVVEFPRSYLSQGMTLAVKSSDMDREAL